MTTFAVGDHVVIDCPTGHVFNGEGGTITRVGHAHPMLPGQIVAAVKLDHDRAHSVGDWLINVKNLRKGATMPEDKKQAKPVPGPLVEDTQTVGGTDKQTGQQVIRPKTAEGKADKLTEATDPRERG